MIGVLTCRVRGGAHVLYFPVIARACEGIRGWSRRQGPCCFRFCRLIAPVQWCEELLLDGAWLEEGVVMFDHCSYLEIAIISFVHILWTYYYSCCAYLALPHTHEKFN
jgi:hypothetical protein